MRAFGFLLRTWSYLFHFILSLFLFGLALVAATSHQHLKLGMLPFTDEDMLKGLFTLAIVGLLSTLFAATRIFKYLFPVWTAIVLYLMAKGFFLSPYSFPNASSFKGALWLTFGALGAFFGGLWVLKPRRGRL